MRYILLGLSCSLTACLEKENTPQDQQQDEETHAEDFEKDLLRESKTQETLEELNSDTVVFEVVSPPTSATAIQEEALIRDQNPDAGEGQKALVEEMVKKKSVKSAKLTKSKTQKIETGALLGGKSSKSATPSSVLGGGLGGGVLGTEIGGLGSRGMTRGASGSGYGASMVGASVSNDVYRPTVQNTEQYTDHGVNEFTKTSDDAHSTFSIDVDTASYTISRKKIMSGTMPPISAVRAEEFINYFSYGYKAPKKDVFNISMKAFVDPLRSDHTYLRVGVQAKEFTRKSRPPLNLSFLVDVSGSMSYRDKLPLAKKSMKKLLESLRPDDTISISTYAGRTALILPATKGSNKEAITQAIEQMESGGGTAMSSGIDLAYQQVWKNFDPKKENRVVVLSDGDANIGNVHHIHLLEQIKSYADRGVTLSTIGFGTGNYKDTRMEQLANNGDGNYYYIDTEKEADNVFVEGFNSTMISVARDVKLQVEFDPKVVSSYRLVGYENRDIADKDFRNDRVDAGEVGAGHSVTALYEIKHTGSDGPLATTRLRYEPPGKDNTATERVYQLSSAKIQRTPSKDLMLAYTAATFAEVLRKSPYVHDVRLSDLYELVSQKNLSVELMNTIKKSMDINTATASVE